MRSSLLALAAALALALALALVAGLDLAARGALAEAAASANAGANDAIEVVAEDDPDAEDADSLPSIVPLIDGDAEAAFARACKGNLTAKADKVLNGDAEQIITNVPGSWWQYRAFPPIGTSYSKCVSVKSLRRTPKRGRVRYVSFLVTPSRVRHVHINGCYSNPGSHAVLNKPAWFLVYGCDKKLKACFNSLSAFSSVRLDKKQPALIVMAKSDAEGESVRQSMFFYGKGNKVCAGLAPTKSPTVASPGR